MKIIKRLLLIACGLIIIGVVGGLLTFKQLNQSTEVSREKTVNATYSQVQLNTDNAEVNIIPTKDKTTRAVLTGKLAKDSNLKLNVYVDHQKLNVELKNKFPTFFNLNFFVSRLTLKVYLPEKQYKSISINNHNGKIHLENFDATNLAAITNNGLIELKNTTSKKVYVRTDNGKISLHYVDGILQGETDNGEISVVTKDLDRPMNFLCDNGQIRIQTDKDPTNVTFDAHVDNGTINILNKYDRHSVIGKGENLIKLATDNGSITVTK